MCFFSKVYTSPPGGASPSVEIHTAGEKDDTLRPNEKECYDLVVEKKEAYSPANYNPMFKTKNEAIHKLAMNLTMLDSADPKAGVSVEWSSSSSKSVVVNTLPHSDQARGPEAYT